MLLINKNQLREMLGNLILLGGNSDWIAEAKTVATR